MSILITLCPWYERLHMFGIQKNGILTSIAEGGLGLWCPLLVRPAASGLRQRVSFALSGPHIPRGNFLTDQPSQPHPSPAPRRHRQREPGQGRPGPGRVAAGPHGLPVHLRARLDSGQVLLRPQHGQRREERLPEHPQHPLLVCYSLWGEGKVGTGTSMEFSELLLSDVKNKIDECNNSPS